MDTSQPWVTIFQVVANLGTIIWLAVKYTKTVDKHSEVIPILVETVRKIDQNQTELFERQRASEAETTRIGAICEERGKKRGC